MQYVVFQQAERKQLSGLFNYKLLLDGLGFPPTIEIPVWYVTPHGQIHKQIPNDNRTLFRSIGEHLDISTLSAREAALDTLEGLSEETLFVVEGGGPNGSRGYEMPLIEVIGLSNTIEPITTGILTDEGYIWFQPDQITELYKGELTGVVGNFNHGPYILLPTASPLEIEIAFKMFKKHGRIVRIYESVNNIAEQCFNDIPVLTSNLLSTFENLILDPDWKPTRQA